MRNSKTGIIRKTALLLASAVIMCACGNKDKQQIPTGKVVKGTFFVDLYEEGELEAVNSAIISSPNISYRYGNLKVTYIVKDGAEIKAGDTVIMFDPAEVQKGIIDAESRLEISIAELEKMIAQQESDMEELKADHEVTRISQEISKIRFEQAQYESEIKKKEIQLNLEQADISLQRSQEQIDNRIKVNNEEVKQKKLSIEQDRSRLREANETLQRLFVTTPAPGIAIISKNWSTGNKWQVGDQVWPANPMVALPDLSKLKATVNINEVDIAKISKGLRVEVKPDAFSESTFTAIVNSVANLAVNKDRNSKIKVFPVEVYLDQTHENLLPGLTVSCRLIVDEIEDVLYVPIDAVYAEGDKFYVYRKSGGGYDKTEVETGASNSDYTIITSGLSERDEVALVDPFYKPEENKETTEGK